jgi:PPE-repeat protein
MYAGAGSGPMWTAAAAWDGLGAELSSAAASYLSVVSGLTRGPWLGPASTSMGAAAAPYVAWMSATAEQVKQAADQARSAAAAYEVAFAATVPPAVIAENRALLLMLVATNIFGQNTPAIAATETHYAEMWAQDATTMYAYASGSAAAAVLTPFLPPPQTTNPAGVAAQATAVGQAAANPAALSQLISTVPSMLQALAAELSPAALGEVLNGDFLNFMSGLTFIASGVLFILGPLLEGPIASVVPPLSALGVYGPAAGASGAAALAGDGASFAPSLGRGEVLAGFGRAGSVGGLSVPQTWASAAPATGRTVTALPAPALVGLSEPEVDGQGPFGGMLPASLMAAAAGGGGAAGSGWAATRGATQRGTGAGVAAGAGAAQSGGTTRARYEPPPSVIPQAARAAAPQAGTQGQPAGESLRDEINELRKQIADLAVERDVLMRSLALWVKGSTGE